MCLRWKIWLYIVLLCSISSYPCHMSMRGRSQPSKMDDSRKQKQGHLTHVSIPPKTAEHASFPLLTTCSACAPHFSPRSSAAAADAPQRRSKKVPKPLRPGGDGCGAQATRDRQVAFFWDKRISIRCVPVCPSNNWQKDCHRFWEGRLMFDPD